MGGVFNNQEELDAAYPRGVEIDDFSLHCPYRDCGAGPHAIEVLRVPNPKGWWSRQGRAKCEECGREFPVEIEPE